MRPEDAQAEADAKAEDGCAPPARKPLPRVARWLLMAFAGLCVVLGLIGAVVPGMPTTVFILMAAGAAARSPPRMHAWLYAHRLFGPLLRHWDDGGKVARRAKWFATLGIGTGAALVWHGVRTPWVAGLAVGAMAAVLGWLWLRPEPD